MNVVGYLRVSGKGQLEGDGFPRQAEAIERYCQAHKLRLVKKFEERGVSGTVDSLDRPGFAELIFFVRECPEKIEGIVVERMDRLARDLMVSETLINTCRTAGLKVFSTDQGVLVDLSDDKSDPTRTLIRQIMAVLAQWERTMLVMKLAAARRRAREARGWCDGSKPFGEYVTEEEWWKRMRPVFECYPPTEVARMLNDAGFTNRMGRPWTKNAVSMIQGRMRRDAEYGRRNLTTKSSTDSAGPRGALP